MWNARRVATVHLEGMEAAEMITAVAEIAETATAETATAETTIAGTSGPGAIVKLQNKKHILNKPFTA